MFAIRNRETFTRVFKVNHMTQKERFGSYIKLPVKDPVVPADILPYKVALYRLETSSIAVNLAQMKNVVLTATEHEHSTSPLWHNHDVRSPVYSMTSSKLYTVTLFMIYIENVKNFCKTEIEPNSFLPKAYHIIYGLWFIATQNTLTFTVVFPQKGKDTLIENPTFRYNQTKHVLYCCK